MKITIRVPRSGSSAEPKLLVRFVIRRCREVTEPPPVLVALALAALSHDHDYHNRLKEVISSSDSAEKILGMSEDLFMPALGQIGDRQPPDEPERDAEYPFPDERNCQQVLHHALHEGKKMLSKNDFEFIKVFQFLTRTGLFCYSYRLRQFEDACQSFQVDPISLVKQGIEIMETITFSPRIEN